MSDVFFPSDVFLCASSGSGLGFTSGGISQCGFFMYSNSGANFFSPYDRFSMPGTIHVTIFLILPL